MSVRVSDSRYWAVAVSGILFVAGVFLAGTQGYGGGIADNSARCAELSAEHDLQSSNCPGILDAFINVKKGQIPILLLANNRPEQLQKTL